MKALLCKSMIPLLGICFFTLFSCRKDREVGNYLGEYELSGCVKDKITQRPVPYALVGVMAESKGKFSYLGGKGVVTGKTDANGKFAFKFYVDQKQYRYELMAQALQYFDMGGSGDQITFTKNGKKSQDVVLTPHSYIVYHIKGTIDSLEYKSISISDAGVFYNRNTYNHSILTDTIANKKIIPLEDYKVVYWVSKGWWGTHVTDLYKVIKTIKAPAPHDTLHYEIVF